MWEFMGNKHQQTTTTAKRRKVQHSSGSVHIKRRRPRACLFGCCFFTSDQPSTPACASQQNKSHTNGQERVPGIEGRQAGIQQIVAPGEFTTFSHEPRVEWSSSSVLRFGFWFRRHRHSWTSDKLFHLQRHAPPSRRIPHQLGPTPCLSTDLSSSTLSFITSKQ